MQISMTPTTKASSITAKRHTARNQFDLHRLIDGFCCWYGQALSARGIKLTTEISPDIPLYVAGSRPLIKHLFYGPGANSLKFNGTERVLLEIGATPLEEYRSQLFFSITARGGIPAAGERELFQPLPAQGSEHDSFRQRAANLYYAQMISRMFEGSITVHNESVTGICYRVQIILMHGSSETALL